MQKVRTCHAWNDVGAGGSDDGDDDAEGEGALKKYGRSFADSLKFSLHACWIVSRLSCQQLHNFDNIRYVSYHGNRRLYSIHLLSITFFFNHIYPSSLLYGSLKREREREKP